jgi:DNA polymerase-4
MDPIVMHADVDAFYASVAQRDDPALRRRPVVVGGWVVMAASYEARAFGVRSGMPTAQARRLCPELVVAQTRFEAFVAAGREVMAILERFSDAVEPASMEEAFLDVTDAGAAAPALAARLRAAVREEAGLPLSVGLARTKVLAKMASREAKPDGLMVVEREREREFLHPLPVGRIWGVGKATAAKLEAHGLRTVGEVAELDEAALIAILGRAGGRYVHGIATLRDPRPVRRRRGRRSVGAQRALGRGPRPRAEVEAALAALAERVTTRMRRKGHVGRTVVLRLRFGDYTRATRSQTLALPTAEAQRVTAALRELLDAAAPLIARRGLTLVGVTVTNLSPDAGQLPLFGPEPPAAVASGGEGASGGGGGGAGRGPPEP